MFPNGLLDQTSASAAEKGTYFSSFPFVAAVASTLGADYRPLCLSVSDCGYLREMYAVERRGRFGSRSLSLAPYGLWASPGGPGSLSAATVNEILAQLQTPLTQRFGWNVRFDHSALAHGLLARGLNVEKNSTHVLELVKDHTVVFRQYNEMIRNHIRRSLKAGVCVRTALTAADVDQYYKMHCDVAASRGGFRMKYPLDLFHRLIQDQKSVCLLLAEWEGHLVAGGVFLRDGCSVMYWHGIADRRYSKVFPACAVLDSAIRHGCETGARFFNFGGSAGIPSLEAFKAHWGAKVQWNWSFEWRNPMWTGLARVKTIFAG